MIIGPPGEYTQVIISIIGNYEIQCFFLKQLIVSYDKKLEFLIPLADKITIAYVL